MQTGNTTRLQEIREIWQQHHWLYSIAGFLAGLLFAPLILLLREDMVSFMGSLVPEAVGIAFTVLFINTALDKQRDEARRERELKDRLVRDVRNPAPSIAMNAIDELRARDWLTDEAGLLQGANLQMTNLSETNLAGVNLMDANLEGATLERATISDANLSGAHLGNTQMAQVVLSLSNLRGAYLADSQLEYASMIQTDLEGATLSESNLHFADLTLGRLINTDFSSANLPGAILSNADLTDANLTNAELSNADLFSANLTNANLTNATLSGADLSDAILTNANLTGAILDEGTLLPDNIPWTPETDLLKYGVHIDKPDTTSDTPYADIPQHLIAKDETQEIHILHEGEEDDGDAPPAPEAFGWTDDVDPNAFDEFFDDGEDIALADNDGAVDINNLPYMTEFGAKIFGEGFVPDEVEVWEFEAIDAERTTEQEEFHDDAMTQELDSDTGDQDDNTDENDPDETMTTASYHDEGFETTVLGKRLNTGNTPDDESDNGADDVVEDGDG